MEGSGGGEWWRGVVVGSRSGEWGGEWKWGVVVGSGVGVVVVRSGGKVGVSERCGG